MTQPVTGWQRSLVLGADRMIVGLARHWLAVFNTFFFLYAGLPFLAPVLMYHGYTAPAEIIYTIYRPVCHQLGYRSWFLFGEKPYYEAPEFAQRTGIADPYSLVGRWQAKLFAGNPTMGYKVAFCERDVAIYGGIFVGGLILAAFRKRAKPMHWAVWLLVGVAPIALDGFSQLLSQPPYGAFPLFAWLPFRESTPLLRTLTGALFGITFALFAYPYVEESMRVTKEEAEEKLRRAEARKTESVSATQQLRQPQ